MIHAGGLLLLSPESDRGRDDGSEEHLNIDKHKHNCRIYSQFYSSIKSL
jgi:hypothetical protein